MHDLKNLSIPKLKLIIAQYKAYTSPKLTSLKKDDLIKLINKFNIDLTNYNNKESKPKVIKEPKTKVIKEVKPKKEAKPKVIKEVKPKKEAKPKKDKNHWFDKQRRDELKQFRLHNTLIGDTQAGGDDNITLHNLLMDLHNAKNIHKIIIYHYPTKYNELKEYIDNAVKSNERAKDYKKHLFNPKFNIIDFISNQMYRLKSPYFFYPPYLQNFIALHGLFTLCRIIEFLFISINEEIKKYIIMPKKEDIPKIEKKLYPELIELSPNEKSSIKMHYHNFLYEDYKKFPDYNLTYYD